MARSVRSAGIGDAEVLARLNRPVQQLHARLYPRLFKSASDEMEVAGFFARIVAVACNEIGICEKDGKPLGYIWSERQQRAETPFSVATARLYIHHVSVIEEARRQGVASSLLNWALQRARDDGIDAFALDHWVANEDARAFFSQRGFTAERIAMSKLVPERVEAMPGG
jgi:GNAT superfamily N-acetyltransferase